MLEPNQQAEAHKKPYTAPKLEEYGDLREITRGHAKQLNDNGKGKGGGTRVS